MLQKHQDVLQKHYNFLIETVRIDELLEQLVSKVVVKFRDISQFRRDITREQKVTLLLAYFPSCDNDAFRHLCESLDIIGQGWVADKLRATEGGGDAVDAEAAVGGASARQDPHLYHLAKTGNTKKEYDGIEAKVMDYIRREHKWTPEITCIEKAVNSKELKKKWETAKENMCDPEKKSELKFHGTDSTAVACILRDGFRLVDKASGKRSMFGKGVYFASDSSKAAQERYTKGSHMLLVCDVLLGKAKHVDRHQKDMTYEKLRAEGYDSLYAMPGTRETGGVHNAEFVVYRPEQALPKYVVHYTCEKAKEEA